jgi:hypothetical protein
MARPLVRWTFGEGSEEGKQSLWNSMMCWHRHYGETCDYVLFFNGQTLPEVPNWVRCYEQSEFASSLPLAPTGPAWKLYPPRFSLGTHELILDNDVVLQTIPPLIDSWLGQERLLCSEAYKRNYGQFDGYIPSQVMINTGVLGLPPKFDFRGELLRIIQQAGVTLWETHFCEQGCVSSVFCKYNFLQLTLNDISVGIPENPFDPGLHGIHFVGLNAGWSTWWRQYLCGKML